MQQKTANTSAQEIIRQRPLRYYNMIWSASDSMDPNMMMMVENMRTMPPDLHTHYAWTARHHIPRDAQWNCKLSQGIHNQINVVCGSINNRPISYFLVARIILIAVAVVWLAILLCKLFLGFHLPNIWRLTTVYFNHIMYDSCRHSAVWWWCPLLVYCWEFFSFRSILLQILSDFTAVTEYVKLDSTCAVFIASVHAYYARLFAACSMWHNNKLLIKMCNLCVCVCVCCAGFHSSPHIYSIQHSGNWFEFSQFTAPNRHGVQISTLFRV